VPNPGDAFVPIVAWLWKNKDWIGRRLKDVSSWFRKGNATKREPGILILGTGGSGKSTLARILSDPGFSFLLDLPGEYEESIGVESYALKDSPGVEIVVPPGQKHRREATWGDLHSDLATGKYRGIIVLSAYGFNNFALSYKDHSLYDGRKERFLTNYCEHQRAEDIGVLRELIPHLTACKTKLWMLSIVVKQDLWWPKRVDAERHYREGLYAAELSRIRERRGREFRHEFVFASLVISNFVTGAKETLKTNAAGYDQILQVQSLRRLFETVDVLRRWEQEP
jgi:hypothetical protein